MVWKIFFSCDTAVNQEPKFIIADRKLYVLVITLSSQDNVKLLKQLESGFKRTINWNKYQSKITTLAQNRYLDFLIDASFQGVNKLFVLLFQTENDGERYLPKIEIKGYNVMIDWQNFFDQPIKNDQITYNIQKIATGQGDDYTTGCLLDYPYFNEHKLIATDSSKQQKNRCWSKINATD